MLGTTSSELRRKATGAKNLGLASRMDLREVFAFNLRRLRHAKGLSQDDLAYEAEVSRSYLSQLEKGAFYASLRIVDRLDRHHAQRLTFIHRSRELGFSLDDIRGLSEIRLFQMRSSPKPGSLLSI